MTSKKGYFIDIEKGVVTTAEEHDEEVIRKFAEWLTKSNYANGYFDTENGFVSVDRVLIEYEKEQK